MDIILKLMVRYLRPKNTIDRQSIDDERYYPVLKMELISGQMIIWFVDNTGTMRRIPEHEGTYKVIKSQPDNVPELLEQILEVNSDLLNFMKHGTTKVKDENENVQIVKGTKPKVKPNKEK